MSSAANRPPPNNPEKPTPALRRRLRLALVREILGRVQQLLPMLDPAPPT